MEPNIRQFRTFEPHGGHFVCNGFQLLRGYSLRVRTARAGGAQGGRPTKNDGLSHSSVRYLNVAVTALDAMPSIDTVILTVPLPAKLAGR